jgi:multiple sugar transport system permease protein
MQRWRAADPGCALRAGKRVTMADGISVPTGLLPQADTFGTLFFATRVVVPVAISGSVAAAIFAFAGAWSATLYRLAYPFTADRTYLAAGIVSGLTRGDVFRWGKIMASGLLASLPPILIYAFLMHDCVAGLTAGATKG